jgi:hypothetical protein
MTVDFPGRQESWITLVGLKDLYHLCKDEMSRPCPRISLRESFFPLDLWTRQTCFRWHPHPFARYHRARQPCRQQLELCRINIATTTLHILRKLDLDQSIFRASSTIHSSPLKTPQRRGNVPAALSYEDPARTITCITLNYTLRKASLYHREEWREIEEQTGVLYGVPGRSAPGYCGSLVPT